MRYFLNCSPFSYRSSNFAIAKITALDSFRYFMPLKALAKSEGKHIDIAFKSKKERQLSQ